MQGTQGSPRVSTSKFTESKNFAIKVIRYDSLMIKNYIKGGSTYFVAGLKGKA